MRAVDREDIRPGERLGERLGERSGERSGERLGERLGKRPGERLGQRPPVQAVERRAREPAGEPTRGYAPVPQPATPPGAAGGTAPARPLRTVLVSHFYPSHRGGVEIVAGRLAQELVRDGRVTIDWFASDSTAAPADGGGIRHHPVRAWNGVERRTGLPYPLWSPGGLLRLARAIGRADAVHVHDFVYFGSLVAFAVARLMRKPVIVTQHIGPVPLDSPLLRRAFELANRQVGARVLRSADGVVFIGDSVRQYFEGFARFRRRPALVPNGVDRAIYAPLDEARRLQARQALGLETDRPVLLFVGRFVAKKGLPMLQALAHALPRCRFALAGWGPIDPRQWDLPNVSVFHGLSGPTLAPLYQSADLLLLPSLSEGFALVVQEAMACGTPALVSDAAAEGSPDAAGSLLRESIDGGDPVGRWAGRIEALLADEGSLRAMRARVAAFVDEHWSWEGCARHYLDLLEGATRHRRGTR